MTPEPRHHIRLGPRLPVRKKRMAMGAGWYTSVPLGHALRSQVTFGGQGPDPTAAIVSRARLRVMHYR